MRLPQPAAAIVVGNPSIADVSVHSSDTIFVVGRGYGNTNLIILNAAGQSIMNADITVTNPRGRNTVRIYQGKTEERVSYNCSPYCQPSPILGDKSDFVSNNTADEAVINNPLASGATTTQTATLGNVVESESAPAPGSVQQGNSYDF